MKTFNAMRTVRPSSILALLPLMLLTIFSVSARAADADINQTEGFGAGQELVFTYLQNFSCIHQPRDDLDHNGKVAAIDPDEFQRPICTVGHQSTIGPTGEPIQDTKKLWVI